MTNKESTPTLIQTKLHRPPLPVMMVHRPRLTKWLKQHQRRPLTLVSAPAGYGKSTLISCWLSSVECPTAWVSLDEGDNKLGGFLSYFLAAVQTMFPNALPETQSLLTTAAQPSIPAIANTLVNELNQIEENFILVLDDYHLIETQNIHDLVCELLAHPVPNFHMVLGTRNDPPLPLVTLRANNQVTEVRIQNLRFNQEETQKLFQKMIGISIDPMELDAINNQAEGWVTGLRLAALALQYRVGTGVLQGKLTVQNRFVTEYLFREILAKQASIMSDCMLKTSILDRFCEDLCATVCFPGTNPADNGSSQTDFEGSHFLEWLQASNLFVIPLDDHNQWFRYHNLFQEFLHQEFVHRFSPDEIKNLHKAAGHWFARHALIEEALNHLFAGKDIPSAIDLVARHRYQMMNATQWPRLERWLSSFPAEVIETSAELWMLKIWLAYYRGQFAEIPALLQQLTAIMTNDHSPEIANRLAGEIQALQGLLAYYTTHAEDAVTFSRHALEVLPHELWIVRVMARMYLAGGLLLQGDLNGCLQTYYEAFKVETVQSNPFKATLLITLCNIHWVAADLQSVVQAAKQSIAFCSESDHPQILAYGKYHLGSVYYQHNEIALAEELFTSVVARPYLNYGRCYMDSACGLALVYQAQGRESEAREVAEAAAAFQLETGNMSQYPVALALQAEIALRQGSLPAASQWAARLDPVPPLVPIPWFLSLHLTLVKVWLAQKSSASLAKAAGLLNRLQEYLEGIHNTRFLIDTLAMQALLFDATGDQVAALSVLEKALQLAQPGGFLRVFLDLGTPMAGLLRQLSVPQSMKGYLDQIWAGFSNGQGTKSLRGAAALPEPLTRREFEILELLGKRLTNKEIAENLVISPGTVKGHTIRIYQKLNVSNRRQAVQMAISLGILLPG